MIFGINEKGIIMKTSLLKLFGIILVAAYVHAEDGDECKKNNPADIVFVLDESGSIYYLDFEKQIQFVLDVITEFDVRSGGTHVGLMTFSDYPTVHFVLDEISHLPKIKYQLMQVIAKNQKRGGTKTYNAIKEMYSGMFSSSNARPGVPHVCVLITDGESDNPEQTAAEAAIARELGITMFAVGVGRNVEDNMGELFSIASEPVSDYASHVDSYSALQTLKEKLAWQICKVTTVPPPTTTTIPTTTTTIPTTQAIEGCGGEVDIMIALPNQAGVADTDLAINFVDELMHHEELSPEMEANVGLTPRVCAQSSAVKLYPYAEVAPSINSRRYTSARIDTHLYFMHEQSLEASYGARNSSVKVGILVVDNKSFNKKRTEREANRAKMRGIHLIVIGIGQQVDRQEIKKLASDGDSWFWVADYSYLPRKVEDIAFAICQGIMKKRKFHQRSLYEFLLEELASDQK